MVHTSLTEISRSRSRSRSTPFYRHKHIVHSSFTDLFLRLHFLSPQRFERRRHRGSMALLMRGDELARAEAVKRAASSGLVRSVHFAASGHLGLTLHEAGSDIVIIDVDADSHAATLDTPLGVIIGINGSSVIGRQKKEVSSMLSCISRPMTVQIRSAQHLQPTAAHTPQLERDAFKTAAAQLWAAEKLAEEADVSQKAAEEVAAAEVREARAKAALAKAALAKAKANGLNASKAEGQTTSREAAAKDSVATITASFEHSTITPPSTPADAPKDVDSSAASSTASPAPAAASLAPAAQPPPAASVHLGDPEDLDLPPSLFELSAQQATEGVAAVPVAEAPVAADPPPQTRMDPFPKPRLKVDPFPSRASGALAAAKAAPDKAPASDKAAVSDKAAAPDKAAAAPASGFKTPGRAGCGEEEVTPDAEPHALLQPMSAPKTSTSTTSTAPSSKATDDGNRTRPKTGHAAERTEEPRVSPVPTLPLHWDALISDRARSECAVNGCAVTSASTGALLVESSESATAQCGGGSTAQFSPTGVSPTGVKVAVTYSQDNTPRQSDQAPQPPLPAGGRFEFVPLPSSELLTEILSARELLVSARVPVTEGKEDIAPLDQVQKAMGALNGEFLTPRGQTVIVRNTSLATAAYFEQVTLTSPLLPRLVSRAHPTLTVGLLPSPFCQFAANRSAGAAAAPQQPRSMRVTMGAATVASAAARAVAAAAAAATGTSRTPRTVVQLGGPLSGAATTPKPVIKPPESVKVGKTGAAAWTGWPAAPVQHLATFAREAVSLRGAASASTKVSSPTCTSPTSVLDDETVQQHRLAHVRIREASSKALNVLA